MTVTLKQSDILKQTITRLRGDAGVLAALVNAGAPAVDTQKSIINHVPQDFPLPYYRVMLESMQEWDTKDTTGYEGLMRLDVWTDYHGDLQVHDLVDAAMDALQNAPLALTTGQMVLLRHQSTIISIEPDGQSHRGTLLVRFLASES